MPETVTVQDLYNAIKRIEKRMVTKKDLDSLIDSVEILNNPKTMDALRRSDEDIKEGRVKEIASVADLLDEL
jgi:hypothetical protein